MCQVHLEIQWCRMVPCYAFIKLYRHFLWLFNSFRDDMIYWCTIDDIVYVRLLLSTWYVYFLMTKSWDLFIFELMQTLKSCWILMTMFMSDYYWAHDMLTFWWQSHEIHLSSSWCRQLKSCWIFTFWFIDINWWQCLCQIDMLTFWWQSHEIYLASSWCRQLKCCWIYVLLCMVQVQMYKFM